MDRLFQKIEVSVRKEIGGQWQPERFNWQDRMYYILEIGRRWQTDDGEHMLVMTPDKQVFELILDSNQADWYLKPPRTVRLA